MEDEIFVNSVFPRALEREARIAAATLGISRSEFMRRAVRYFLLNHVKQPVRNQGQDVRRDENEILIENALTSE